MENSAVRDAVVNYEGLEAFADKYLKYDHSAYMGGYVSRRYPGYVDQYFGKYGFGFRVHTACWVSSRYHHVCYYVVPGSERTEFKKLYKRLREGCYDLEDVFEFLMLLGERFDEKFEMWDKFCNIAPFFGFIIGGM